MSWHESQIEMMPSPTHDWLKYDAFSLILHFRSVTIQFIKNKTPCFDKVLLMNN
ncbi:hypothetical protein LHK_01800 [Laribacter hongkongensis HLHK9]|uniref:Uncharacterized protein n=1 Tax=Laribacter hongkongensis (strain HLHK9) TaxID=557598 RepID=C1D8J4_LARHH|nr:hypothetical protein LHK_01800 [Laribacter hongkongensis HLHK9]